MVEVLIDSIRVSLMNYQRVVILKERGADRYLPIWIGSPEADAIAVRLQDVSVPRPLTHDLLGSVITTLGAEVDRVVVTDLNADTFYAKLVLRTPAGESLVDCRPSDAIAIAVRGGQMVTGNDGQDHWFASFQEAQRYREETGLDTASPRFEVRSKIPIFVEETVLEKAGVLMDADGVRTAEGPFTPTPAEGKAEVSEEELERMSAFSEFIKDLPGLEDLGEEPEPEPER
jgi:bifunctional DNase/RNase